MLIPVPFPCQLLMMYGGDRKTQTRCEEKSITANTEGVVTWANCCICSAANRGRSTSNDAAGKTSMWPKPHVRMLVYFKNSTKKWLTPWIPKMSYLVIFFLNSNIMLHVLSHSSVKIRLVLSKQSLWRGVRRETSFWRSSCQIVLHHGKRILPFHTQKVWTQKRLEDFM